MKNKILFILCFSVFTISGMAQSSAVRSREFNLESGLAIQGFDPVAYFTLQKAVEGNRKFAVNFEGVTYHFASATNKEMFLKDPKKFEPQYGGWCAYAMGATGEKVEIDPETFKVLNGKLYLYYHSWTNNTLVKWNKDEANLKAKAEKNWKNLFD